MSKSLWYHVKAILIGLVPIVGAIAVWSAFIWLFTSYTWLALACVAAVIVLATAWTFGTEYLEGGYTEP